MTKIFLDKADNYTVNSNNNSSTNVYGSSGTESVTFTSTASGVFLDQNIEKVSFPNASSSYKFAQAGNWLKVYDNTGATQLAVIPVQGDADGTALTFTISESQRSTVGIALNRNGCNQSTGTVGNLNLVTGLNELEA